jgi:threonyl-tRNA synthetase
MQIPPIDILIDDGGHTMIQQIVTFEEMFDYVERLASYLRRNNFPVDYDLLGRSFAKQIAEAENKKSKKIIIVSKEDLETNGEVILRDSFQNIDKKINITKDFDELVHELVVIRLG